MVGLEKATIGCETCSPTVSNLGGFLTNLITINYVQETEVRNLRFSNVTAPFANSLSLLVMENFEHTQTVINGVHAEQVAFGNGGLISVTGTLNSLDIGGITVMNSVVGSGLVLIQANVVRQLWLRDVLIRDITASDFQDEDATLVKVNMFDLQRNQNFTIENFDISDCGISLVKFGSIINNSTETTQLSLKNFTLKDSIIISARAMVSTLNLESDANLMLKISQFYSKNVTFKSTGSLMQFAHGLINSVTVEDSIFGDLQSASIKALRHKAFPNVIHEVSFMNCTFSHIYSLLQSLIIVTEQATVSFTDSSFDSVSTASSFSGIIESSLNSVVRLTRANFTNNSAVISTLFHALSGSVIECSFCYLSNNFGLSNAIITASSNGYFRFRSSTISKNIAIQAPFGRIVDASQVSLIDSTNITGNLIISPNDFNQEVSGSCSKLCFLDQRLVEYIKENNLQSISEGFDLIEIVSGSLQIINNTLFSNQNGILNVFMSTLTISGTILRDINFTNTPIKLISSSFEMYDVLLTNIQDNSDREIILTNVDTQITARNITYENSNTRLLSALSGVVEFSIISAKNITNAGNLLYLLSCDRVKFTNITLSNLKVLSDQIIKVEKSYNVSFGDSIIEDQNKTVISIIKSQVDMIKNMNITNCFKALSISNSNLTLIQNLLFTKNGKNSDLIHGGAVKIIDSIISIKDTMFLNNIASKAGAIDFECFSNDLCKLDLDNVTFTNNSASVQGGAIYYNLIRPKIFNSTFINNSAQYGPDLASYPVKMKMKNDSDSQIHLTGIGSGVVISAPVKLALLDYDNQVMNLNNVDQVGIFSQNSSHSIVGGANSFPFKSGIATVEGIIFESKPGSKNVTFNAPTSAIDSNKVNTAFPNEDFSSYITVDFRFCEPGEEITHQNTCRECDAGTYSVTWNSTQCVKCMDNAECLGRNQVSVNPGYWRASQTSTFIAECINKGACKGGFSSEALHPVDCAEGYQGELCAQCIANKNAKYRKVGNSKCEKCPSPLWNAILIICLGLVVFAFMMVLIVINIRKTKESELSVLLRILTNYLQLIFASLSLSSDYPTSMIQFFEVMNRLGDTSQTFLSFDCFIRDYQITSPFGSNAILKLFLLALLPLILFGVVALIWIILYLIKHKYVKNLQRNLAISFISILFLLHPKLTEQSLNLLQCVEVNEGDSRVTLDTSIKCYSSDHILYISILSVPILIVWVVSLPVTALTFLFIYIKRQSDNKIKQYFLILYQGLKQDKFYWEFVNTARKIFILTLFPLSPQMKMLVAISGLVTFTRFQIRLQPYTDQENNKIEISAINAGILTIFSGLLYSQKSEVNGVKLITMVLCVALNVNFMINWFYLLLKSMKDSSQLLNTIYRFLAYILRKQKEDETKEEQQELAIPRKKRIRIIKKKRRFRNHKRRLGFRIDNHCCRENKEEKKEDPVALLNTFQKFNDSKSRDSSSSRPENRENIDSLSSQCCDSPFMSKRRLFHVSKFHKCSK
ncbi:unnamed protein product [Moneuplotes crassus]|uniref:Uncharacterized protein n=1 Tax=Euplotes crassus TaxID=5936 RepID=A0AAD2CW17_EUPCR|nr:unnamed protein product [Moneuplotes crassus]